MTVRFGRYFRILEPTQPLPDPLPPPLRVFASHLRHFRSPSEAVVPVRELSAASFPKLHVSGGHSAAYEGITDALAARLGGERAVIEGGGHAPQRTGERFNAVLRRFLAGEVLSDAGQR